MGSAFVRTSALFTNNISGDQGYLNEGKGQWDYRELICMTLVLLLHTDNIKPINHVNWLSFFDQSSSRPIRDSNLSSDF